MHRAQWEADRHVQCVLIKSVRYKHFLLCKHFPSLCSGRLWVLAWFSIKFVINCCKLQLPYCDEEHRDLFMCARMCCVCVCCAHNYTWRLEDSLWCCSPVASPFLPFLPFWFFFFMTGSLCVAHYPWNEWLLPRLPSLPLDWNPSETLNPDKPSFSCLPGRYFRHSNTKWNECSQWGKSPWEICCVEGLEVPGVLASLWVSPARSSTVCSISVEGSRQWA